MNLHTNYPYWLLKHGIVRTYPSLTENIKTEIAVLGAGISGALVAWQLCKAGKKVTVIDRRHVGMGSTAASTALLQYEIDVPLVDLIEKIGERNALKSYLLCLKSISDLGEICGGLASKTDFVKRPSFQFASFKKDVRKLEKEYRVRKAAGIELDLLGAREIEKKFGFSKIAGLFSQTGAAVDAYALTHALLADCGEHEIEIFDHTCVREIVHKQGKVELITDDNNKITASKLIIACGYESQKYLPKQIEEIRSTYAIVSEPFASKDLWYKNALIWETANPYLYLRTTQDNRVLIGGKDDDHSSDYHREEALPGKTRALEKSFRSLFPGLKFKTDFNWAGLFASTKDGLPYIGQIPQRPNTYFALGFGGNGITFSVIAAQIITDHILGKRNPDAGIFGFER